VIRSRAQWGEEGKATDAASPRHRHGFDRYRELLLFVLPIALATIRYYPIIQNYFFSDDFLNLYHIADDPLLKYLVTPNGGHVLLTRNAIFYLSLQLFGTDPRYYFWIVLLTHLINVALLFRVIQVLTASSLLASFGAALWGMSPLHEGTLGWYSVYGQVLVATCALVILYQALRGAAEGEPPRRATRAVWYVLALAAASSFGTGTGIAIVLPVVLGLLLPAHAGGWKGRLPLLSLVVVVPVFYVAQIWAYQYLSGVDLRTGATFGIFFSDGEAILRFCLRLMAFGLTHLVGGAAPPATLPIQYAILGGFGIAVILLAWTADVRVRRQLTACALLAVTTYGVIAFGRGALQALLVRPPVDVVPLLPRYHYTGQLFLTLVLCALLGRLADVFTVRFGSMLLAAWYAVTLVAFAIWTTPLDHHAEARDGTRDTLAAIRAAVAAEPPGGTVRIENRVFAPLPFVPTLFPGWAAAFTIFFPENVVEGRRVYFVERRPAVIESVRSGKRMGSLLVPP